jgi:hypothetical protein
VTLRGGAGSAPADPPASTTPTAAAEPTTGSAVDPFGLWDAPGTVVDDAISFGLPASGEPGEGSELPAAVWTLSLTGEGDGITADEGELERRAAKIQAINAGLEQASERAGAFLAARRQPADAVSFGVEDSAGHLPAPEADLAYVLSTLEPGGAAGEVSFGLGAGLGQDLQRLAGQAKEGLDSVQPTGVDWDGLRQSLDGLLNSVNRQVLHFVWVDTALDGRLAARTTVKWGGDLATLWGPGLTPEHTSAHGRSLQLSMASRTANLRTVMTVSQIAGKIALAVTTPLGPMQALALAWMFTREVIMPLVKQAN